MEYFHSGVITGVATEEETEFILPSRRFASKPKIKTFVISKTAHAGLFGKAVYTRQLLGKLLQSSTYSPARLLKYARMYAAVCIVASIAISITLPFLTSKHEYVYAKSNQLENLTSSALSESAAIDLHGQFADMLETYHPSVIDQATVSARTHLISRYLYEKGSPLAPIADVIARQPHWKMILAISFAESNFGKRCIGFNCSGIGGSKVVQYDSYAHWIESFNRLMAKRYADKTIPQMCGVYVQPCNPNWMLATTQVLAELSELQVP